MERAPGDLEPTAQEFEGVYVVHWEVPRFVVTTGRGPFGLWSEIEKWAPRFPDEAGIPEELIPDGRARLKHFRMRLRGSLGPRGSFGHLGV